MSAVLSAARTSVSEEVGTKISCRICGATTHAIPSHLKEAHPEITLDMYRESFPDAPILSEVAKEKLAKMHIESPVDASVPAKRTEPKPMPEGKGYMHEVFELGDTPAARNGRGEYIGISVNTPRPEDEDMIPKVNRDHIWDVENLKNMLMAFELNLPMYVWGFHGTGKTTDVIQVCARTKRPLIRVQHTINTEEAHIVGQWTAVKGETVFQPGPLPLAMMNGWVYLADEYDFGLASVLSVYQAVLEGEPLVIKDADPKHRIIVPQPGFRFIATGNSNGGGDETGLYQGVSIQNAANYDRFGMTIQKRYMPPELETQVIVARSKIGKTDAKKLIDYATKIRESFEAGRMSTTISPRALINAAMIGIRKGNLRTGLMLAYGNKLSRVDREVADGIAQRVFG